MTAVCVDLEGFGPRELYRLSLQVDPAGGTITVLDRGDPAAVVDPRTFEVTAPAPRAAGAATGPSTDSDRDRWIGWALAGAGATLITIVVLAFVRRRRPGEDAPGERRPGDAGDGGAPEHLARTDAQPEEAREDRECDPVR